MLDGDRIGNATVDVFVPVDLDRRRHQRQRSRGAHGVEIEHSAFDRQVRGGSKQHVRCNGVHLDGAGVERLVVKGIQAVLDIVEDKVVTHNRARGRKRRGAHEAVVVAESQVDAVGTADLVRLVVHAVERTGRDAVHRRNFDTGLHENVEHAGGKLPTKLPPSKTSATLPAFFALSSAVILTSCDCVLAFFYPVLGWRARRFFEAAGEAESASQFEAGFRDALSAWTVIGKARPVLSADSRMNYPLEASSGK